MALGFGELAHLIRKGKRLTKIAEHIILFKVVFINDLPVAV